MNLPRSFEGPEFFETFGEEEKRDGDEQNANGDRGAEGPIVGGAEEALDDIGDHSAGGSADEKRSEEVAEGEDEGKRGTGEKAGHGERKNDAQKSFCGAGAEILRGFDERTRDVLEGGVDGEKDEGSVDVREDE